MNFFSQKIFQGLRVGLGIAHLCAKPESPAVLLAVLFSAYGIEWLLTMSFVLGFFSPSLCWIAEEGVPVSLFHSVVFTRKHAIYLSVCPFIHLSVHLFLLKYG